MRMGPLLILAFLIAACGASSPAPLPPILDPDLASVGPLVRDQIKTRKTELEQRLAQKAHSDQIADAYGELGMLFHAYNFRPEARLCYEKAATHSPDSWRWRYYLAKILERQSEFESARTQFEKVLSLEPRHAPSLIATAEYFRQKNELEKARTRFERALSLPDAKVAALIGLAQIALAQQENQRARDLLQSGLTLQPDNAEFHYLAAMVYRRLNNLEAAEQHVRRHALATRATIVVDPLMEEIHFLEEAAYRLLAQADQALNAGQLAEALNLYRQSIGINPNLHESRVKYAYALAQANQKDEALAQYRESLRLNAGTAIVHYNIGGILAEKGLEQQAIASYQDALEMDSRLADARLALADALRRGGRFEEAAVHYQNLVDEQPKDSAARLGRALCLIRQTRFGEAISALEQDIRVFPDEPVFPHTLARILAACPDAALRDGLRAAELLEPMIRGRANLDLAESVAMAMAETGRFDLAVQWQTRAIKLARDSGLSEKEQFLAEALNQYRLRRPCRSPWREDDPLFYQKTYRRTAP